MRPILASVARGPQGARERRACLTVFSNGMRLRYDALGGQWHSLAPPPLCKEQDGGALFKFWIPSHEWSTFCASAR